MSNKTYDRLKQLVQVVLPALGTLYFTLADLWHLSYAQQIVGTTSALALFFGLLLRVYNKKYWDSEEPYDGTLSVTEGDASKIMGFEFSTDPEQLIKQPTATFKLSTDDIPGLHEIED
jgi:hypothetical protein